MCFIVTNPKIKTAKKDIVCYKVGYLYGNKFHSPCKQFYYRKGKKQQVVSLQFLLIRFSGIRVIECGYHSYTLLKHAKQSNLLFDVIGKFIIPKGTKYYENDTEYVSETIIFKGLCK